MKSTIVYFDKPGKDNTEETLRIARQRADELGIKTIIVATTAGNTAVRAAEVFRGMKVIAVTHSAGFKNPDTQEFTEENRKLFTEAGGIALTSTHLFSGVGKAMRKQFATYTLNEIVAATLRLLGQGLKVIVEIAVMAADAGLVSTQEDAIVIAGTGRGADYAVILKPVYSGEFFNLRVKEILCKPRFSSLEGDGIRGT
jgi:uncharacterized protein